MIEVLAVGSSVNYTDRSVDDTHENEFGFGHWVFMHFTTPFLVDTPRGRLEGKPGDILINSPDYPQWHKGRNCCFKNDWLHFNSDEMEKLLNKYDIPCNIPFSCPENTRLQALLLDIQREHIIGDPFQREKTDLLVRSLIIEMARNIRARESSRLSEREKELLPLFKDLRIEIHQDLSKPWTVAEMADRLSLSENRFAVLYKRFFGVSPIQDQLNFKLSRASALLLNKTAKIRNIAQDCGFSSEHYFWRMFKKAYHITPSDYRKSQESPF